MKGDNLINGKKSDTIFIDIYEIVNDELYLMGNTFKKIQIALESILMMN